MKRQLILADHGVGHPLRAQLRPFLKPSRGYAPRDDDKDLKLFALSFTAFFICFYTFLL